MTFKYQLSFTNWRKAVGMDKSFGRGWYRPIFRSSASAIVDCRENYAELIVAARKNREIFLEVGSQEDWVEP